MTTKNRPRGISKVDLLLRMTLLVEAIAHQPEEAAKMIAADPWLAHERICLPAKSKEVFNGERVFSMACSHGQVEVMRALLDAGAPVNAQAGDYALSAVHLLLKGTSPYPEEALKLLLARGARVDMLDATGAGVLYTGAALSMETFELLMGAGAPIDCHNSMGEHYADKAILDIPREHSTQNDQMVALVNAGLDLGLGRPNGSNRGPLTLALLTKNFRLAELLIEKGCSLRAVNNQGRSVMYSLAHPATIEWVLDLAPELVDQRDRNGQGYVTVKCGNLPKAMAKVPSRELT